MTLLSNTPAISPGCLNSFKAVGGVEPYIYSIVTGEGTIDADTGLFTAGNLFEKVTVKATDSDAPTPTEATYVISVMRAPQLVIDIIRRQMSLQEDQVYLYNQKIKVPPDDRLYIALKIANIKTFANTTSFESASSDLNGIQSTSNMATIEINVVSRTLDALDRKDEVLMALNSTYSQQQQTLNGFGIGKVPIGFVDLSEIEGSAIPYRFNISFQIQYVARKVATVDIYTEFEQPEVQVDA